MARKYVTVTVRMYAEITGRGEEITIVKEALTGMVQGIEAIDAGEVDVEVQVHGGERVNSQGFARATSDMWRG